MLPELNLYTNNKFNISNMEKHFNFISKDIDRPIRIFPVMMKSPDGVVKNRYANTFDDVLRIVDKAESVDNSYNWYISVNSHYKRDRKQSSLQKIGCIFVDVDNHDAIVTKHDIESLIYHLNDEYFDSKLPYPSMIVSTGRGVQIYWKIKPISYNPKTIVFWNKIERAFINIMSDLNYNGFSVDKTVKDASRVLRLAGTPNHNSQTVSEILYISDETYTLTEISQGYVFGGLSTGRKYVRKHRSKKKSKFIYAGVDVGPLQSASLKKRTDIPFERLRRKYTHREIEMLLKLRLRDLEKLMELRDGKFLHQRQDFIFVYGTFLRQLDLSEHQIAINISEINSKFDEPLSDSEALREAYRQDMHYFRNYKIVERFGITKEEQQSMAVLRTDLYNIQKTTEAAINREKRMQKHQQTLEKVKLLTEQGKSLTQIASELKIHSRTVSKYRRELGINKTQKSNKDAVLILKNNGLSQQEVAEALKISMRTVRNYWNINSNKKEKTNE